MIENIDRAHGTHIDRRSLLKKAGAAGALGLAAPITFDSFFSPAAAASCSPNASASIKATISDNNGAGANTNFTSAGFSTAVGDLVIFMFTARVTSTSVPTVTVTAAGLNTLTQRAEVLYQGTAGANPKAYLWVYTGIANTASSQTVAVQFTTTTDRFAGHVASVTPSPVNVVGTADSNSGTYPATSPSVTLSPAPAAGNAQMVVFAIHTGSNGNNDPTFSTPSPAGFGELADVGSDGPNSGDKLGLATSFNANATSSAVTSTPGGVGTPAGGWAAVTLDLGC